MVAAGLLVAVVVVAVVLATRGNGGGGGARGGATGGDFHSLVIDPATADVVYVGGHTAVSVSTDGGRTWTAIDSLDDADAMGWAFDGSTVWVSGHPGISRSTDGATAFSRANEGLPDTDIHALGGTADRLVGAGPAVGVITSTDGGATWSQATAQAGHSFFGRIAVDANESNHLVAADAAAGVVESIDGGATWRLLEEFSAAWVSVDDTLTTIVASGAEGAIMSTNAGTTWELLSLPDGASLVELDVHHPPRLITGIHDGSRVTVMISEDGGTSWAEP